MENERNTQKEKTDQYSTVRTPFFTTMAIILAICDGVVMFGSWFLALLVRFDFRVTSIPQQFYAAYSDFILQYVFVALIIFALLHLYRNMWRFAGYTELNRLLLANIISGTVHVVGITVFEGRMPVSYYLIGLFAQLGFTTVIRFGYRYISLELRRLRSSRDASGSHVMIIGGGDAGHLIIREMNTSGELKARPCCIIDDDSAKWGSRIEGVPVVGGREAIAESVKKYSIEDIYFAIPSASAATKKELLDIAKETACKVKVLPGLYQLIRGDVSIDDMKPVEIEDLLGREPVKTNMDEIYHFIKGRTILVTGGGGSIGSELCRQIAAHEPGKLIILDIYENNAYEIQQELIRKYGGALNLEVLIGSVRDCRRIEEIFDSYRPEIVYHAAAHKHVPLMEENPCEAVKNNCLGTYRVALAALKYGTKRFVLISTDKAVNPTNVMGASKRVCEMIIQSMDSFSRGLYKGSFPKLDPNLEGGVIDSHLEKQKFYPHSEDKAFDLYLKNGQEGGSVISADAGNAAMRSTQFVAVRFGNVLGSNGSVVPLFRQQIREGGPVTVTHPDIVRYFMTIPEAVSLVMQAGVYAAGGEVFVLDMGEPIKIDTLARNIIKLSGLEPDVDIPIVYTGLRPGEKLYEERLMAEEGLKKTANDLIYIGKPVEFDITWFFRKLTELEQASYGNDEEGVVSLLEETVPTFKHMEL